MLLSLPNVHFYSSLTDKHVSDDDYAHAHKVWDICGCKTLGDYLKLYLEIDVSLLADITSNGVNRYLNYIIWTVYTSYIIFLLY